MIMKNQFKRVTIYLLPTNERSNILFDNPFNELQYHTLSKNKDDYSDKMIKTPYHLYLTLKDEKPKLNDWVKWHVKPLRTNWVSKISESDLLEYPNLENECEKIIATTDNLLISPYEWEAKDVNKIRTKLPQPSILFIQKYIRDYNKDCRIKEVLVKYEEYDDELGCDPAYYNFPSHRLKINLKDNTITIKKLQDKFDKDEILELFLKCNHDLKIMKAAEIRKWHKENL